MEDCYNYVFHCNKYEIPSRRWACIHRDEYLSFWNGEKTDNVHFGATPEDAAKKIKVNAN